MIGSIVVAGDGAESAARGEIIGEKCNLLKENKYSTLECYLFVTSICIQVRF